MLLALVTPAASKAVTLAEAKSHLRVEHAVDDTLIQTLIDTASAEFEGRQGTTRRAFITQTWDMWLPYFPAGRTIELPLPPLQSVTYVKYFDGLNAEQTLDAANYEVVKEDFIGRVVLNYTTNWPSTYEREKAVNIRFVCGYGAADVVPMNIKQAMLLRVGELYAGRGDDDGPNTHKAIKRLLAPSTIARLH